jgi:alpha-1,2-mannosyltransferase
VYRTRKVIELGLFVEVPIIVLAWLAWGATKRHWSYYDLDVYRTAARAVLHGHSPYVAPVAELLAHNDKFVYPTPYAFLFVPFVFLPGVAAKLVFLGLSVAAVAAALNLIGVRDWRCYGLALLGVHVFIGLALGTIGPLLLVLVAAAWRYRDRAVSGVLLALAAAAKVFLWPLLVWLVATRRIRASAASLVTLGALGMVWALVDLNGLRSYPETLRVLNDVQRWKSYSPQSLAISFGASVRLAEVTTLVIAVSGIAAIAVLARRGDGGRSAFAISVVVALLATPILWLHYLIFLLLPIGLARPRLSRLWLAPIALWITPHTESIGTVWKIAAVLTATVAVAVLTERKRIHAGGYPGVRAGARSGRDAPVEHFNPVPCIDELPLLVRTDPS